MTQSIPRRRSGRPSVNDGPCSIEGCSKPSFQRRLCFMHYSRLRRNGSPYILRRRSRVEMFQDAYVVSPSGCWLWKKPTPNGYGRVGLVWAHRLAYELLVGPIPTGLELDHLCRAPACVNPAHLEPVTHFENLRRGNGPAAINARKTHCIRGHGFTAENTYRPPSGDRRCRTCVRWKRSHAVFGT